MKPIEYNLDCFELKDEKSNFKSFRRKLMGAEKDQETYNDFYDSEEDEEEEDECDDSCSFDSSQHDK